MLQATCTSPTLITTACEKSLRMVLLRPLRVPAFPASAAMVGPQHRRNSGGPQVWRSIKRAISISPIPATFEFEESIQTESLEPSQAPDQWAIAETEGSQLQR